MTLKERLMKDSWDYDFPLSNRQAESIVNMMDNLCIEFAEWCDDNYFRMGNTNVWSDSTDWEDNVKYTTRKLLKIFKKEKGL